MADLLKRYREILKHSWKNRHSLDAPKRLEHEAQFLPAALALQDTPISPAPRLSMWLIMGFAAMTILWAIFGNMDVVATAQGKILPGDRTKTIQPFETASVAAIHVTDGQRVKAGDLLIELDATEADADQARFKQDEISARLQVARARAMLSALSTHKLPPMTDLEGIAPEHINEARSLLQGVYAEYTAKDNRLVAQIERTKAERVTTSTLISRLEKTVTIAQQRAADIQALIAKGAVSQHDYLEREQARIEQEGELTTQRSRLTEITAGLSEARGQRIELTTETRRIHLDQLNEGLQKLAGLKQELRKTETRHKHTRLLSPVAGTVQQLAVHTVGGVVTPAQALMLIVPEDNALEIEAFVENKDIGFVKAKQAAEVKVETFQYTKYGTIASEVISVSHDAIEDEKRGLIYSTRVRMSRTTVMVDGAQVKLSAGMAVTVEVKTGKRRVIEYFLSPLIQHTSEAMRER